MRTYTEYKRALRQKELVPAHDCENCLSQDFIHGHHIDYDKPLEVVWLCRTCHMKIHSSSKFSECRKSSEFQQRTSPQISQEKRQKLYQKLGLNQYRRIPIKERCTQEERAQLDEYEKLWNQFMTEYFKAKDNANFYYEKMQLLELVLKEKYPLDIEELY